MAIPRSKMLILQALARMKAPYGEKIIAKRVIDLLDVRRKNLEVEMAQLQKIWDRVQAMRDQLIKEHFSSES